jgi:hypothetical protein
LTPVEDRAGQPLLAGARLVLAVARLERGRGARPARVELVARRLVLRCGAVSLERPLAGRVRTLGIEQLPAPPSEKRMRSGAVAGVLFGLWLGGFPGALLGYDGGVAAGVALSFAERPVEAHLGVGARLTVVLDEPLAIAPLRCPSAPLPQRATRS